MPAAAAAAVTSFPEEFGGKNHQAVLEIIIDAFFELRLFFFLLVFILDVHTRLETPYCPRPQG